MLSCKASVESDHIGGRIGNVTTLLHEPKHLEDGSKRTHNTHPHIYTHLHTHTHTHAHTHAHTHTVPNEVDAELLGPVCVRVVNV
jgi:hypothetical protein